MITIFIQLIASFIAVVCFAFNLEVPKKYVPIAGAVGSIAWITYLICNHFNLPEIMSYFISIILIYSIFVLNCQFMVA